MELKEYQKKAIVYGINRLKKGKNVGLFMETGSGKTIIMAHIVNFMEYKSVLFLTKKSILKDVKSLEEFKKYSKTNVKFTNYEQLKKYDLTQYDCLILDECHEIKNPTGKINKEIVKFLKKNKLNVILATATPFSNTPLDLFGIYRVLEPTIFGLTKTPFIEEYATAKLGFLNVYYYKQQNIKKVLKKIEGTYFNFTQNLPFETFEQTIFYKFIEDEDFKKLKDGIFKDENGDYDVAPNKLSAFNKQAKYLRGENSLEVANNRIKVLEDVINKNINKEEQFVIYYQYNFCLEQIVTLLERKKMTFCCINGLKKELNLFLENKAQVLLCQFMSGSVGINLQNNTNKMFLYGLTNDYKDFKQAKGRIARLGQTKNVYYYYIIANHKIDKNNKTKIIKLLEKKAILNNLIINGG